MDARTQQQLTVAGATQTRMKPAQLWIEYFARGGVLSQIELEAYLLGVVGLSPVERDILALTLNEILQNTTSQYRVPYSTDAEVTSTNSTGQMISGSLDQAQEIVDQALSDLGAAGVSFLLPGEAEYQRLVAVDQTGLVDTAAEERFDRITRQAQEHFGVSSASVALITDRRQFLKSVVGPLGQNTPRDVALCNETIRRAGPLIINDTLADLRFRDNPLVTGEPRIRFYAGYPIFGTKGWAVGTFCIIDQKPRGFSADDQQELKALAMIIQQEINN
ncbi:GAF domain-containing protein [Arthrobacter sp. TB 23]|uniref:GAF domain-containing protein n=1 Tax=Arthrobacter sp. TB 23 TaxID=494419 RepID=UPI0002FFF358|nr:GAF domain-containing protein [Arthrobacter sp. TB 23]